MAPKIALASSQNLDVTSFNAGEIGKEIQGRTSLERYAATADILENMWPLPEGPMTLRPGFGFYSEFESLTRLRRWVFSLDQKHLMAFSDNELRIVQDGGVLARPAVSSTVTNGAFAALTGWTNISAGGGSAAASSGFLTLASDGTSIAGVRQQVSTSNAGTLHALRVVVARGPVKLKVGSASGGDQYITTTELRTGTHSLAFTPTGSYWIEIWSSLKRTILVDSATIEAAGDLVLPTPWLAADYNTLRFEQSRDVLYVSYGTGVKKRIERRAANSWSITDSDEKDGPFLEANVDESISITPSVTSGNGTLTASVGVFQAGHVGALWKLTHAGQLVSRAVTAENQFSDPVRVTGVGAASRTVTVNITGSWSDITVTVQKSIGNPGDWSDVSSYTANQSSVTIVDGSDNEIVYYRIGVKTGNYPAGVAVSNAVNNGSGLIRLTVTSTTGWSTGEAKLISGVGGVTNANGTFTITVINATTIDLQASTFAGTYTSGGSVGPGIPTVQLSYGGGSTDGIARITGYTSPTLVDIEVLSQFAAATATSFWSEGSWSDVRGWPKGIGLFDGRLWNGYADEFWGSQSDLYESQAIGDEDDDAINRLIATGNVAQIQAILPLRRLIMLTDSGEVVVKASDYDEALTPANNSVRDVASFGAADLAPYKLDNKGIYVDRSSIHVMELSYSVDAQDYVASPLTRLHKNIGRPGLTKIAFSRRPETRMWATRSDGQLVVKLYEPGENVLGWARAKTALGDKMIDVEVLPGAAGEGEDEVWAMFQRRLTDGFHYYLEKLGPFYYETLADASCLDSFVRVDGPECEAVTFSGSTYLERGADLTGVANGKAGLVSFWTKFASDSDDVEQTLYASTGEYLHIRRTSGNKWRISGKNAAGAVILDMTSASEWTADSGWHHVLIAWDLATGAGRLRINGVDDRAAAPTLTNDTLDYTRVNHHLGVKSDATLKLNADIAQLYVNLAATLDISTAANQAKFRSASGWPVQLGTSGATPTGAAPAILLNGDQDGFGTNAGTAGNFTTIAGVLYDAEDGPPKAHLAATSTVISGLDHLEGLEVTAWVDGIDLGEYTVEDGEIDVGIQPGQSVVGLTYTGRYRSSKLALSSQMGTSLAQRQQSTSIILLLNESGTDIEYGSDFTTMDNVGNKDLALYSAGIDDEGELIEGALISGITEQLPMPGGMNRDPRLCIRCTGPAPATIQGYVVGEKMAERT